LASRSAAEILQWAWRTFPQKIALATSLSLEDQLLTDLAARTVPELPIFTLDTGRLFQETYDLIEKTEARYGIKIQIFYPEAKAVEQMVNEHGVNLFRKSMELRKHCCFTRKVLPLKRALAGKDAWLCGLRQEQSVTRSSLLPVEWDETNGLVKINPLWEWSSTRVKEYIQLHRVPYNPLQDQGYPSIGCACCTRAIREGEEARAGRWWWEAPEHKECGLHWKEGRLVPAAAMPGGQYFNNAVAGRQQEPSSRRFTIDERETA
jgi:phosphoadenosine phosphosulfate reductase